MKSRYFFFDDEDSPRAYRSMEEVQADLAEIRRKICEVREALNPRYVLLDLILDVGSDPEQWSRAIRRSGEKAEENRTRLLQLEEALDEFHRELRETGIAVAAPLL